MKTRSRKASERKETEMRGRERLLCEKCYYSSSRTTYKTKCSI